ncbi:hypothetical protein I2492_06065 [Budviciaceae bacterium CWB-B4]|uniref:DUF7210 domain-containing protein n=1 Tax=Limnobaculum xujianqingii TaxID=2738837 RepID=A0A9D7AH14_9GAMM|nr:hypothetical protein [Limnobaculum xujianqingii]MBK5072574.1 hypothetical protein [Limnobaculum xujianqingii]MBK5175883.1 hypothetical protein [Limnobaculum xujianqingii]
MKITLLKAHKHANKPYLPGDELDVDTATGNWLIDQKVGKATKTKTQEAKASPQTQEDPQ